MRNLTKNYSFVNGSRTITVTGLTFDIEDIRLIVNETQKYVICSSMQKDLITSVSNGAITYSNSLPALATGDKLTVEIDSGVGATYSTNQEVLDGKTAISNALVSQGQSSSPSDSLTNMASKITSIKGEINVCPTTLPYFYHDMADILGGIITIERPRAFCLLLDKGVTSVNLNGGSRFDLSDGRVFTEPQTVTFDTTKDNTASATATFTGQVAGMTTNVTITAAESGYKGNTMLVGNGVKTINTLISDHNTLYPKRLISLISGDGTQVPSNAATIIISGGIQGNAGKQSRWVIISSSSAGDATYNFGTSPNIKTRCLAILIHNIRTSQFVATSFNGVKCNNIMFTDSVLAGDEATTIDYPANHFSSSSVEFLPIPKNNYTTLTFATNSFLNSSLRNLSFPEGVQTVTINTTSAFQGCAAASLTFPSSIRNITISAVQAFNACSLESVIFPSGTNTLNFASGDIFWNCTSLAYVYIGRPSISFSGFSSSAFNSCAALIKIELENIWNHTINLVSATALTAANTKDFILDRLADKRGDKTNASTCSTSTSSPIVTFTNGNCLEIFRAGDTITPTGGTVRTILSVDSANQITLTANSSNNLSNVAYNINKTLTLATAVKTALSTAYGATWADAYTAKGWTIA